MLPVVSGVRAVIGAGIAYVAGLFSNLGKKAETGINSNTIFLYGGLLLVAYLVLKKNKVV